MKKDKYNLGIGMMSGTSLDGVDLALCQFNDSCEFEILHFASMPYSPLWKERLEEAPHLSGLLLRELEITYSEYIAGLILTFIKDSAHTPDYIACHGHTIFHQPEKRLTLQMLDGSILASTTGFTTVSDFRSGDMALGGQGAPLVPIGDSLLFRKYSGCLNLGGIANLSYTSNGQRIAYDISPANLLLNELAKRVGVEYDKNGRMARSGTSIEGLLKKLDSLNFYIKKPPKSLGREWLEANIFPAFNEGSVPDLLATSVEHISNQVTASLNASINTGSVLITGGGAHNAYLIERIMSKTHLNIEIPSARLIDAKEALVFAFLGKLRLENKINILSSVTGASRDSSSGAIYLGC